MRIVKERRENRGVNVFPFHYLVLCIHTYILPIHTRDIKINYLYSNLYIMLNFVGRSVGGGPMRSRRNIDTSPYGSNNNAYLSPPQESSWRRTSSDSALHQSLSQAQVKLYLHFMGFLC